MKSRGIVIVYALIIVLLVFAAALYMYRAKTGEVGISSTEELECVKVDGEWMEFPNGCVDSCGLARSPGTISCIQAFTYGCDCGLDRCWNGETCEKI